MRRRRPRRRRPELAPGPGRGAPERVLGLLGIARRAGRVVIGTNAVTLAARNGKLSALVVAGDASANAMGRLGPEARSVERLIVADRAALGKALGRTEVAVAGVTDGAFARRLFEEERGPHGGEDNSGTPQDPGRQVF